MKSKWWGIGAMLLLGGCSSVEMANYMVTSNPEVALNANAKVRIVAQEAGLAPMAAALKAEIGKSGSYSVVEDGADYWFVLSGATQYTRQDTIREFSVGQQQTETGTAEVIVQTDKHPVSAAKGVSVAVYEASSLTPVHYMDVPLYSGEVSVGEVRAAEAYDADFSRQVVERVMDAFVTQRKRVETPIPSEADESLRLLFKKGDYDGFLKEYGRIGKIDLAKYYAARCRVQQGVADDATKASVKDVDRRYANYFLWLLVAETKSNDPKTLAGMRERHLMMLETSTDAGLAKAIPVALARLELKIANLGK